MVTASVLGRLIAHDPERGSVRDYPSVRIAPCPCSVRDYPMHGQCEGVPQYVRDCPIYSVRDCPMYSVRDYPMYHVRDYPSVLWPV